MSGSTWFQRVAPRWVPIALLAVMALQLVAGLPRLSATFDETTHLPSGYSYWVTGDLRLNPQHPPLVKWLAAAPLLALDPTFDERDPAWRRSPPDEWGVGWRFLYDSGNDAERMLWLGRLPIVALTLALACYVLAWASRLFGRRAGWIALALCAFSPTLIAHGRLVTFDVPLACFATAAVFHQWRFHVTRGLPHLLLAGLALGAALATKFSGVVVLGSMLALQALTLFVDRETFVSRVVSAVRDAAVIGALAALVVWATYGFPLDPGVYLDGLLRVNADHREGFEYYLAGRFRAGGFWYYFPAALALKTPLPTLLATAGAIVAMVVGGSRFRARNAIDEAFLILPPALFFLATCLGADDVGVRYLAPVLPALFVFVGRLGRADLSSVRARLLVAAASVWLVAGAAFIHPHQIAYFNELAGGPSNGHRWLDDSNIDWGQDMERLAAWVERRGLDRIHLRTNPYVAPAYYGIPARPVSDDDWAGTPAPGVYVMGTHLLIRGELYARRQGVATDWLSRYRPIDRIGYSLWVYEFPDAATGTRSERSPRP